jgi:putative peptidoglycan lipid II flippase
MSGEDSAEASPKGGAALLVAAGIFASRLLGLVRDSFFAWVFGVTAHGDVWRNALKAPNALQNLLGEQTLSATMIPIYSRLLAEKRDEDAGRFAGAIFGILLATVAVAVSLGVLLAPLIVAVLNPGFLGDAAKVAAGEATADRYQLLVAAVRILFPMTGVLVLSAWALGILNSHRRFLLSYSAPVLWNVAILAFVFMAVRRSGFWQKPEDAPAAIFDGWLEAACWGALAGGLLQFLVQLPAVFRLCRHLRFSLDRRAEGVRPALAAVGPALAGRGVVQLSLYLDTMLGSFLAVGAPSAIGNAGNLLSLPISLFGMSVAAAELPELARQDPQQAATALGERIARALRQTAFVIWPSLVAFLLFGYLLVGLLYRRGNFTAEAHGLVMAVLAAYGCGLLASTASRQLQNPFYALRDTRTPARIAGWRLLLSAGAGLGLMVFFDRFAVVSLFPWAVGELGLRFGAVGLGLASSLGAWLEFGLLRRALARRLPGLAWPSFGLFRLGGLALAAAAPALLLWWRLAERPLWQLAPLVLGVYGLSYLGAAYLLRMPELGFWLDHPRLARLLRK